MQCKQYAGDLSARGFSPEDGILDYRTHLGGLLGYLSPEAEQLVGPELIAERVQRQPLVLMTEHFSRLQKKHDFSQEAMDHLLSDVVLQNCIVAVDPLVQTFNILLGNAKENLVLLRALLGQVLYSIRLEQTDKDVQQMLDKIGIVDRSVLVALSNDIQKAVPQVPEKIAEVLERERHWYLTHIGNPQHETAVKEFLNRALGS